MARMWLPITGDGVRVISPTRKPSYFNDDADDVIVVNMAQGNGLGPIMPNRASIVVLSTLTITGLINGCELRIYDNEDSDFQFLGTELAGEETLSGTTYDYVHDGNTNQIVIQMIATGYEEIVQDFTLTTGDQSVNLIPKVESNI